MIIKHSSVSLIACILFVAPFVAAAACTPLTRTLKMGMKGEDMRTLQAVLNSSSDTTVALSGPGSAGNETMFFGAATVKAVKKFQLLHASEVLTPAGVSSPTGVVGKYTRDKLNAIACAAGITASTLEAPSVIAAKKAADAAANTEKISSGLDALLGKLNSNSIQEKLSGATLGRTSGSLTGAGTASSAPVAVTGSKGQYPLQLFTLGPMVALRGGKISLSGTGFSSNTRLRLGSNVFTLNGGMASDTAVFTIPSDFPYNAYSATLEDGGVSSNPRWLIVAQDLDHQPVVQSLSPDTGNVGSTITVRGKNFADKNSVTTSLGVISDISSSDGTTLTFTLSAKKEQLMDDGKLPLYVPLYISVVNKNGASNLLKFTVK